ncbi:VPLPA-CTERM sorting domain-containing protein [Roseovarius sp. PS-C2]|uniref:VPLPA-CTERM sorting domain-containing protein n=1 Tax=Roseovarius sp. PS-C2 TaxID=2820814 RepID=UPI001C0D6748|nr:VPLPA-CTERM sorting domain-containing protein [Roseovarius sp. PS-C2]MBU3261826.1 VPLPA-CTERM sorting domain-containing protein [Roseovarius sp. PS-C2]
MFKTLKLMVAALATAVLMTGAASALTVVSAGNSYDITSDNLFLGAATSNGGAGSYSVNFFSPIDPVLGKANASVTLKVLGTFSGLTMSWVDAATNTVLQSTAVLADVTTNLNTMFTAPNLNQNLVFNWTDSAQGVTFDFDVAAVPLPAGGVLLLTALGGLGLARRRRKVA